MKEQKWILVEYIYAALGFELCPIPKEKLYFLEKKELEEIEKGLLKERLPELVIPQIMSALSHNIKSQI